ncbi:sulfotransferase [Salinibacillus aidingensis]|uniref:Sulfotransferase n=1 Tax=Salinibacillus aidingensis TaxID=237684 RepID=A0ABN1AZR2_9BACI
MKSRIQKTVKKHYGNHPSLYTMYDWSTDLKNILKRSHKINHSEHFNPFFIVGSGRSGNTLFRSMLSQKDEIVIPPESFVLGEAIRKYKMYRYMEWEDLCGVFCAVFERHHGFPRWGMDIREFYKEAIKIERKNRNLEFLIHSFYSFYGRENKETFTRWGDKTPINTFSLKLIDKVFPDSQFIHMIRDARDVVSSYIKAGLYQDAEGASQRWINSINTAQKFGKKVGSNRYMEVYYEELVRNPEPVLRQVCEFLGIEFEESMLHHVEGVDQLKDTRLSHHTNLYKPVNPSSIGKWKKNLSEEQQQVVEQYCRELMENMGYTWGQSPTALEN